MSSFKCYDCDGILVDKGGSKYFTYFVCKHCGKFFCLAHDGCDTWSWLNKSKLGTTKFWTDCKDAMHKKNSLVKEKVVFT